jgi:hypothetical protein
MSTSALIEQYLAGPRLLREAIAGMTSEQLDARPVAGKWSTKEVICHIADFEPVYLDRIKRVIAENEPTMFGGDPDLFAARLAYSSRDVELELKLIEACRVHLGTILRALPEADFARRGLHSVAGPMSIEKLLTNIAGHIPHHLRFIAEKRAAMPSA